MTRKKINIPKVLCFFWLKTKNFEGLHQQLKHQKLRSILELSGKTCPDLVKVLFTNLQFNNGVLMSYVKGMQLEISKKARKEVVGLRQKGAQVRKGETSFVEEFNKMLYYRQCLRRSGGQIKTSHVGGLKVDERLLAMIITKIIVPHGRNNSTLNESAFVLIYCI